MSSEKILLITQGVSRVVQPLMESGINLAGVIECIPRNIKKGTHRDRLFKMRSLFSKSSLKRFCLKNGISYTIMYSSNEETFDWIKSLNPTLIVVFSMSQLLDKRIFSYPKFGAINLHPSYLPEYRGPNPCFWQYYDLVMNPGVTIHYIDENEDTGDIIYQDRIKIDIGIKSPQRLDRLIGLGSTLLVKAIKDIHIGVAPRKQQTENSPTKRARNLKIEEHKFIIKWNEWPIERIWHLLRGTETWLNAIEQPKGLFTGQRWQVVGYEKVVLEGMKPGSVYTSNFSHILCCRDGIIHLKIKFNFKSMCKGFLVKFLLALKLLGK